MNDYHKDFNRREENQKLEFNYCTRCRMREADFKCESCSPFLFFCASCDGYVHSMNSKRQHIRDLIEKRNLSFNREDQSKRNYEEIKENQQITTKSKNFYKNSSPNFEFQNSNKNLNNYKENYMNDMSKLYDGERDDYLNRIFTLEKQIEISKLSLNEQIINLQHQIEENNRKHKLTLENMIEEHEIELRRVLNDKETEIRQLFNKNRELERGNNELLTKINEYQNEIFQIKNLYSNKLTAAEFDNKQKDNELADIKNHYEKRISIISDNLTNDKGKIISNYEKNIEKLNQGYKDSKEKYLSLLNKRDNDFNEVLSRMKKEEIKYENIIEILKSEISKLKEEISSLNETNNHLKIDLKSTQENLEMSNEEALFYLKESQKSQEDHQETLKHKEELKLKYKKLHTITHGKFKSK